MGEILGLGMTHHPGLLRPDEPGSTMLSLTLKHNPKVPEERKNPLSWPEGMRTEFGEDEGLAAATKHREKLVAAFRKIRAAIDDFKPDFLLVWGDDQYENFKEDIIPAFCVLAWNDIEAQPFRGMSKNPWHEPKDKVFQYPGCPKEGRYLAKKLLEQGIDMAYAYKPLHKDGLGHAFVYTLLFLDYDRTGIGYPVLPFQVNCYGSRVIRNRGQDLGDWYAEPDPPAPTPKRCMEVGAAVVRALKDSPWRVATIASSSWSHAFLTEKNHWLHPDIEADRARLEEFRNADWDAWRRLTLDQIEESGQQELLNWMCLAGAMEELGRKPEIIDWVESWVCNSNKCFALFRP